MQRRAEERSEDVGPQLDDCDQDVYAGAAGGQRDGDAEGMVPTSSDDSSDEDADEADDDWDAPSQQARAKATRGRARGARAAPHASAAPPAKGARAAALPPGVNANEAHPLFALGEDVQKMLLGGLRLAELLGLRASCRSAPALLSCAVRCALV